MGVWVLADLKFAVHPGHPGTVDELLRSAVLQVPPTGPATVDLQLASIRGEGELRDAFGAWRWDPPGRMVAASAVEKGDRRKGNGRHLVAFAPSGNVDVHARQKLSVGAHRQMDERAPVASLEHEAVVLGRADTRRGCDGRGRGSGRAAGEQQEQETAHGFSVPSASHRNYGA